MVNFVQKIYPIIEDKSIYTLVEAEHATGHLLYSRFLEYMFLKKDRGYINQDEPFQKLINQRNDFRDECFCFTKS